MKNNQTKLSQRVRYALLAGMAGAFLIPQVGFAAPMGEHGMTTGVTVNRSGSTTNIGASATNNVIKWQEYSVANGETVAYDAKNYLNLVTGGNTSAINGSITGGGKIYLVNPNGVIFGRTASVNVGSLYVSTQPINTVNQSGFTASGVSPLSTSAAGLSDVVNMGSITATNVEVMGKNIRFLNAANVTSSNVVMYTDTADDGTAHIGYRGSTPTSGYTVNGAAATAADNYYQLVATTTEFQDINNDLTKNYMLENDIDLGGAAHTPIGGNTYAAFTGKFDGNFYKVKNFTVSGFDYAGVFGKTNGARIENLGVDDARITGNGQGVPPPSGYPVYFAGGIVAEAASHTTLKNVYATNGVEIKGQDGGLGGIVGHLSNSKINTAYSKVKIGEGGGIAGWTAGSEIDDSYSDASHFSGSNGTDFVYLIDPDDTKIRNSYATGSRFTWSTSATQISNTYQYNKSTGKTKLIGASTLLNGHSAATYAGWSINNDGTPGAKWRIYEGRTAPLLTAFMSGTATATYKYRYFNANGSPDTDTGNTVKSNNGADLSNLTYNSKYLKIVDEHAPTRRRFSGRTKTGRICAASTSPSRNARSASTMEPSTPNACITARRTLRMRLFRRSHPAISHPADLRRMILTRTLCTSILQQGISRHRWRKRMSATTSP